MSRIKKFILSMEGEQVGRRRFIRRLILAAGALASLKSRIVAAAGNYNIGAFWKASTTTTSTTTTTTSGGGDGEFIPGGLFMWGRGTSGELGRISAASSHSSPVQIGSSFTEWKQVVLGNATSFALHSDGKIWGWGLGTSGQLAQISNLNNYSSPVQVTGASNWKWVGAGGSSNAYAINSSGELFAWGQGSNGSLGQVSVSTMRSSPVQITGTTWQTVVTGFSNTVLATKTNGELWGWGQGTSGNLAQVSSIATTSSPVQITGTNWKQVAIWSWNAAAVKSNGELWCWGKGTTGELGEVSTTVFRSSPVQVTGTNWKKVACGEAFTIGLKSDGTLFAWGSNASGMLGQNDLVSTSSPVQITGTNWMDVSATNRSVLALKSDQTLWAWGVGTSGQLGMNDLNVYSSPVQVTGTSWVYIFSGTQHAGGIKTSN